MTPWHMLCTAALTIAVCGIAAVALGCVWPADPPPRTRPAAHPRLPSHRTSTVPGPTDWTCALPGTPLSPDDAHNAARHHREHDCPRKRAAFATLVAYGCIVPDTSRRPYRQKVPS
ncbi:hypothetical protein GCM10011588_48530 [Nocardia jinanensis]|uniref:Uncharacterized protein n=1 Tax=Nocardia jinanensis TaxID=382504 RepID=A0A917RTU4_9NOCA|nr:hypothetical protein GCM10011588_48530 [Nocardia jinanensis]